MKKCCAKDDNLVAGIETTPNGDDEEKGQIPSSSSGLQQLIDRVQIERNALLEQSSCLFKAQQEFLKKYEDLRALKMEGKRNLREYADKMRNLALKEAELRYQEENLANIEHARSQIVIEKQTVVAEERDRLQSALESYRATRTKIADLQRLVMSETQEERHKTEEIIEALFYAKVGLETEMRRPSQHNSFPTKKEIAKTKKELLRCLERSSDELREFHADKLISFRRHERILLGRVKDAMEQSLQKSTNKLMIITDEQTEHNLLEGHDSLESRIAQRMFAVPDQEMDKYDDSDNEDMGLPGIGTPGENRRLPPMHQRRRKFSILQSGEVERLQTKWAPPPPITNKGFANTSHTAASGNAPVANWQQKKLMGTSNSDVVYDPDVYLPFCNGEYIRPHLLLDMNQGITDKEERILNLAAMLCNAKGKVIQMNSIKEVRIGIFDWLLDLIPS